MPLNPSVQGESSSGAFRRALLTAGSNARSPATPIHLTPSISSNSTTPEHLSTPTPGYENSSCTPGPQEFNNDSSTQFECSGNYYIYDEKYNDSWLSWWHKTPGYAAYQKRYAGKRNIRWNSNIRGSDAWKYFRQCARKSGPDVGSPHIQCLLCYTVLAHPGGIGTKSMNDHTKSMNCNKARQKSSLQNPGTSTIEELFQKGTRVCY
jgi:hypothetical protein